MPDRLGEAAFPDERYTAVCRHIDRWYAGRMRLYVKEKDT